MKVQDVSHRTGQGVGRTLVEGTGKHKYMVAGTGKRSRRQGVGYTVVKVTKNTNTWWQGKRGEAGFQTKNEKMWRERKKGAATR